MSNSEKIRAYLEDLNPEALLMDGFDDALIGIASQFSNGPIALYDRSKCIEVLMRDGATWEEAEEYFSFNCEGAWLGKTTPIIAELTENLGE